MAAWINGAAAEDERALEAAAALLAPARAPLIAGLVADLQAIQAAYRLAKAIGAALDPVSAPCLYGDLAALAGSGALTTTRSEALARADLVLTLGHSAAAAPIVAELAASKPSIGARAGWPRRVLRLGGTPGDAEDAAAAMPGVGLAGALGVVRACAAGRLQREDALGNLAQQLHGAAFGVVVYEAGELEELAVEMVHGLLAELSEAGRIFALSLSDPWQGPALLQIAAWTTGQGPRVGFGRNRPEHDPWRFDGARQAAEGETDASLWLASLPAPRPAWTQHLPLVALVGEATGAEGDVVMEVGVPGDTASGVLWDERRGALAFRPARRPDDRPSAALILDRLTTAVLGMRSGPC